MIITNPDRQTRIAYHEAGHAVMAYLRQSPDISHVTLKFEDDDWQGKNYMHLPFLDPNDNDINSLWTKLLIARSGMGAERVAFESVSSESINDRLQSHNFAVQLALASGEPNTEFPKYIQQADIKAKEILTPKIGALSAVADRLLQNGFVSLSELTAIMEGFNQ